MNTKLAQLMALDLARALLALELEMSSEELDAIYQRFLALDENKMPNPNSPSWDGPEAPRVTRSDLPHVIFVLSRVNYRSLCASIALHLSWGKPLDVTNAAEMLMWLDEYEEQQ